MKVSEVSETQADNLVHMLDAYAEKGGHHLNINVFNRETLLDAQAHPEKYPQPRFRLCRELPHAHQGAAGRGHCAYLPRQVLKGFNSRRIAGPLWVTFQNVLGHAKGSAARFARRSPLRPAEMFWKVTQSGPAGVLCSHPLGGTLLIIWMSRLLTCAVTVFPLLLGYALFVCKRLTC